MKKLISWVEIPATDMNRAVNFYNSVLGLNLKINDFGDEQMACFPNDEGAISKAKDFKPSRDGTLVSFFVNNGLESVLKTVTNNGGEIVLGKTKVEAENRGYFSLIIDSEGNKIGLYES